MSPVKPPSSITPAQNPIHTLFSKLDKKVIATAAAVFSLILLAGYAAFRYYKKRRAAQRLDTMRALSQSIKIKKTGTGRINIPQQDTKSKGAAPFASEIRSVECMLGTLIGEWEG